MRRKKGQSKQVATGVWEETHAGDAFLERMYHLVLLGQDVTRMKVEANGVYTITVRDRQQIPVEIAKNPHSH